MYPYGAAYTSPDGTIQYHTEGIGGVDSREALETTLIKKYGALEALKILGEFKFPHSLSPKKAKGSGFAKIVLPNGRIQHIK